MSATLDAYNRAARAYPGGIPALAARMGMNPVVLRNKLNGHPANKLTLAEVQEIDRYTDCAGLHEQAHEAGHLLLPDADAIGGMCCDTELMTAYARHVANVAASAADFAEMMADGRVEAHEVASFRQWLMRGRVLENRLLERLQQVQEPTS